MDLTVISEAAQVIERVIKGVALVQRRRVNGFRRGRTAFLGPRIARYGVGFAASVGPVYGLAFADRQFVREKEIIPDLYENGSYLASRRESHRPGIGSPTGREAIGAV